MYKILFFLCFFNTILLFGNEKYDCVYRKNSKTDILKKYPFHISDKIIWVSWKSDGKERPKTIKNFTADSINWQSFADTISIDSADKKMLADILFNYKYRVKGNYDLSASCYIPRDAILFLDKNEKLIDYLEVCFECTGYRLMTEKWKPDFCDDKFEMLEKFKLSLKK